MVTTLVPWMRVVPFVIHCSIPLLNPRTCKHNGLGESNNITNNARHYCSAPTVTASMHVDSRYQQAILFTSIFSMWECISTPRFTLAILFTSIFSMWECIHTPRFTLWYETIHRTVSLPYIFMCHLMIVRERPMTHIICIITKALH